MVFNSIEYLIFLPLVVVLYYLIPHRHRWILLLTASCVFYMWFVPKYILILLVTIIIDYSAGLLMERDADSPILPIGLSFHTFQSMTRSKSIMILTDQAKPKELGDVLASIAIKNVLGE